MGSILAGRKDFIARARRARKQFGGALRQAGIVAASACYALDHHIERLAEDHENARRFGEIVANAPGLRLDPPDVQTNLVFVMVDPALGTSYEFSAMLREQGILMNPSGPQRLRAVTHLDISREQAVRAAQILAELAARRHRTA
jgi:threonine aldolase